MVNVTPAAHEKGRKIKQSQNGSHEEVKEVKETVGRHEGR
jgi:hypothetical protein